MRVGRGKKILGKGFMEEVKQELDGKSSICKRKQKGFTLVAQTASPEVECRFE